MLPLMPLRVLQGNRFVLTPSSASYACLLQSHWPMIACFVQHDDDEVCWQHKIIPRRELKAVVTDTARD